MAWRDELQPGSFRGVPFLIDASSADFGRRVSLHEYPLRDTPYGEDLGRRARQFSIECLVLGPDYMAARDRLIAALEAPGAGTLVHPYLGTRRVVVAQPASVNESTREGGVARFRIPFAEAGEKLEPEATADTATQVQGQADATGAVLANSFASQWSVEGTPQWVSDAGSSDLVGLTDQLQALRDSIPGLPDSVTVFNAQLQAFSNELSSLIRTPFNLGASVVDLVLGLGTIARQPIDALGLYRNLLDFGADQAPVTGSTPARQQQATNRAALQALVRGSAVAQAAAAASRVPAQTVPPTAVQLANDPTTPATAGYGTADQAVAVRDALTDALDDQSLTADDDLYPQLVDLRAAVVRDIGARVAGLPNLITFTPGTTLPALVVAYRLYGDAGRAEEIVARNDLRYPGFATGGQALEVLGE
ncbi:DNA circularization protein [Frateuria sp. YIM B11624]|uniref:DNA circularization protein n=1 Tax=Frateuria sp. YIM B11624 TaxID=3143185 RepID=UPI003C7260CA